MEKNLRTLLPTVIDQEIETGRGERLKCHKKPECVFSQITEIPKILARIGKPGPIIG